jgi:acetolactate synthase-1/3 small subunit
LIDTVKVRDLTDVPRVERELMLIKLHAPSHKERDEILRIAQIFRGKVVDISQDSIMIELTGDSEKIKAFLNLVRPFGIKEMATTGKITLKRESVLEEMQD